MVYVNANRRQHLYPGESAGNVGRVASSASNRLCPDFSGNTTTTTITVVVVVVVVVVVGSSDVNRSSRFRSCTRPRRRPFRPRTPLLVPRIAAEFLLLLRVLPIRYRDSKRIPKPKRLYKEHDLRLRQQREQRIVVVVVVVAVVAVV